MANAQTKGTKTYQAKIGSIRERFHTHQAISDQFKKACEVAGISQNEAFNNFMEEFVSKYLPEEKADD